MQGSVQTRRSSTRPAGAFGPGANFWMHFGRPLAPFSLTFGSLLAPFGSLLAPFGSLLAHFASPLAHFWRPLAHFWCLVPSLFTFLCIFSENVMEDRFSCFFLEQYILFQPNRTFAKRAERTPKESCRLAWSGHLPQAA